MSLLQNAHALTCLQVFGKPDDNVQFVHALVKEVQSRGHDVFLVEKNSTQVCKMLDAMILGEEITKKNLEVKNEKAGQDILHEGMEGCQHEYADCKWP